MSEKGFFRHYRLTDKDAILPQGGATVYYVKQEADRTDEEDIYNIGVSFCSLVDNFKKSTGRSIAEGRFVHNHETIVAEDRDTLNKALLSYVREKFHWIQIRKQRMYDGDLE